MRLVTCAASDDLLSYLMGFTAAVRGITLSQDTKSRPPKHSGEQTANKSISDVTRSLLKVQSGIRTQKAFR